MVRLLTELPLSVGLRPLSAFMRAWCVVGLLVSFAQPIAARAMSCAGPVTVCSSFAANALVFRGRVVDVTREIHPEEYPSGNSSQEQTVVIGRAVSQVRFAVEEVFRGEAGAEIVLAAYDWGLAGTEKGKDYLIFAGINPTSKALTAQSVCSSTHVLTRADSDPDLEWLRAYASADNSSFLFGRLFMRGLDQMTLPEDQMPAPVAIRIKGNGVDKTVSPVHEKYRVDKLEAGTYTVMAVVPVGTATDGPRELKLAAKSCSEVDWQLYNDSHITGRVTDAAGAPTAGATVDLGRREANRSGSVYLASAKTDSDGHYDFAKVAPGEYLVSMHGLGPSNVDPHRKAFYSGVNDVAQAKTIQVGAAVTIAGIDLIAAPPVASATVHARMLYEDGSPVAGGRFFASNPASAVGIGGTADAMGIADLSLYVGEEYTVVASGSGPKERSCGGPVTFIARDGMTLDPLILDRSWQACHTKPSAGDGNAMK